MNKRMLSGEREFCRSNASGVEDLPIAMKAFNGAIQLLNACFSENMAPSDVAKVQKGTERADHILGDVSFDGRQVDLKIGRLAW
jgi:hypothetical protein